AQPGRGVLPPASAFLASASNSSAISKTRSRSSRREIRRAASKQEAASPRYSAALFSSSTIAWEDHKTGSSHVCTGDHLSGADQAQTKNVTLCDGRSRTFLNVKNVVNAAMQCVWEERWRPSAQISRSSSTALSARIATSARQLSRSRVF